MPKQSARRNMDDALKLTPQAMDFIQAGASQEPAVAKNDRRDGVTKESVIDIPEPAQTKRPKRPAKKKRAGDTDARTPQEPASDQMPLVGQLLVPLTTRLQPKTAEMLRRACLEQKLRGKRPHTQQEIIELATQAWLSENGYLQ